MSYMNGSSNGGYMNGYSGDYQPQGYRIREPRAANYGAIADEDNTSQQPTAVPVSRPSDLEREKAKRRSHDGGWSSSRSLGANGRAGKDIEDIVEYIQQEWNFMTESECIPAQVALQLLDESSLGLASRSAEFHQTQTRLQNSLKAVVNEHHQGFNSSIGTFHQIQGSIQASQKRVRQLKESLVGAKANLTTTKPELKDLFSTVQRYDEMLEVLNIIEELQQLPAKLEATISEKRFLTAVELLQDALRLARRSNLDGIGGLTDMKVFLSNQQRTLADILVEELHNHLYLKSPYCEDRWKPYAKKTESSSTIDSSLVPGIRQMVVFLEKLDTTRPMSEGTSPSPETDTFDYIHLVVEALNKLGQLDVAVDAVEQRLPVELYKVVEKSNIEVGQRHPASIRSWDTPRDELDFSEQTQLKRGVVLSSFLRQVYARFEAIAESHRVLHDILSGIAKREVGYNAPRLTRGFKELWKLFQSEMRSILHDYLSSDGNLGHRAGQSVADRNIFRYQRDRNKRLFKLDWTDSSSTELTSEKDDLMFTFKSFVPGLVSLPTEANESGSRNNTHHDSSAAGHKLLVEPSVFNMGTLLPPSISFLRRLKDIVPAGSEIVISTLSTFLNDFLINVFHPQLEETLIDFCLHTFVELDAFQKDLQWGQHSQKPVYKSALRFFSIIITFCKMLDNLTHDQLFSHLVVSQMNLYHEKCCAWYKGLVSRSKASSQEGRALKAAASFAEGGDLHDVVEALRLADSNKKWQLTDKETKLLIAATEENRLTDSDLIADPKSLSALCLLYTSMIWLSAKLSQLRHISDRAFDSSGMTEVEKPQLKRTLTGLLPSSSKDEGQPVYLPLNSETARLFDNVISAYRDLGAKALQTIHLEFRCHIVRNINKAFENIHILPVYVEDPDPSVLALVADLVAINEELRGHLLTKEHDFVVVGSTHLLDALLVHCTSRIQSMNIFGCRRMQLNVLVLRQNLLNIDRQAALARSSAYFELFIKGPDAIIADAKQGRGNVKKIEFSEEELKVLIELWYSGPTKSQNKDEAVRAQRSLSDGLLQLSEAMWQS